LTNQFEKKILISDEQFRELSFNTDTRNVLLSGKYIFDKTKVGKFMFFSLGIAISLSILHILQQWFGSNN